MLVSELVGLNLVSVALGGEAAATPPCRAPITHRAKLMRIYSSLMSRVDANLTTNSFLQHICRRVRFSLSLGWQGSEPHAPPAWTPLAAAATAAAAGTLTEAELA